MNRGNMHPFLYAMRMRGLRHGSEEEYDMFEEFAICRAKNRRMNGAAESRLQFEPTAPSVADTTRSDEHLVQEDSSSAAAEDGNCCSQPEKDPALATTESPPSAPHTTAAKGEVQATGNVPVDNGPHVYTLDAEEQSPQPDPSTSSSSAVLQITIQVRSAQKKKKCGEHAVCNESPLQAGGDELE